MLTEKFEKKLNHKMRKYSRLFTPWTSLSLVSLALFSPVAQTLDSTTAAIGLKTTSYTVSDHDATATSIEYEANTNFDPCTCNLTAHTCDAFCCCDKDCSSVSNQHNLTRVCRKQSMFGVQKVDAGTSLWVKLQDRFWLTVSPSLSL
jgi:hypothetical protein